MGNHINIYDKDGNFIGYCVHGMMCGFYAEEIIKKYIPDFTTVYTELENNWKKINEQFDLMDEADKMVIAHFYYDDCSFDESDIPALEKAIADYPDYKNDNPKIHLQDCIDLTKKYGKVRYKYEHTSMAMAITKG